MPINRASARDLLLPGLADIEGKYPQLPTRYKEWASTSTSKMAMERIDEMRYTGLAQLKGEGAATTFDNASGQRFTYVASMINVGLGFAITREMLDDNLYKEQFGPSSMGLAESFAQFKEVYVHTLLNNATTYNSDIVADFAHRFDSFSSLVLRVGYDTSDIAAGRHGLSFVGNHLR